MLAINTQNDVTELFSCDRLFNCFLRMDGGRIIEFDMGIALLDQHAYLRASENNRFGTAFGQFLNNPEILCFGGCRRFASTEFLVDDIVDYFSVSFRGRNNV